MIRLNPTDAVTIGGAIGVVALLATSRAAAQPAQFVPLGFLPGNTWSEAYAVNDAGTVVVGRCLGGTIRAFRWTPGGGIQALGNLHGRTHSYAWGLSADGSVIAGESESAESIQACRWNAAGQMELLGGLPGFDASGASGISANGAVIVGSSYDGPNEAVRWTAAGAAGIGDLPGDALYSHANDASADGSVVVGQGHSELGIEAFRWTVAGGMQGLGDLSDGNSYSVAQAVAPTDRLSSDGGMGRPVRALRRFDGANPAGCRVWEDCRGRYPASRSALAATGRLSLVSRRRSVLRRALFSGPRRREW